MAEQLSVTERYAAAHPCVGCGFCCRQNICCLGLFRLDQAGVGLEKVPDQCPWLHWIEAEERYECLLASQYPGQLAIGAGCSSTLFNEDRDRTILRLTERGLPLRRETPGPDAAGRRKGGRA